MHDPRITIRGAGMHPYKWGAVRFSVWIVLALWVVGAGTIQFWLEPVPMFPGLVSVFIISTLIYLGGYILTKHHPFFPEIIATAIWRGLRRAYYLHS